MRYSSIVLSVFLFAVPPAAAGLTPRPLDPLAADTFALARQRSALVRAIVGELESSNVIVHIESSRTLPQGIGGATRFIASRGGYRYVRITIAAWLPPSHRAAIMGHELQHAVELARAGVTDVTGVRRLVASGGYWAVRGGEFFETREALRVERAIRRDLRASSEAQPVIELDHHDLRAAGAKAGAQVAERGKLARP